MIRRANPALRELDRVLAILAEPEQRAGRRARDSRHGAAPVGARSAVDQRLHRAGRTTTAPRPPSARRRLEQNFEKFPEFLRELRPTMRRSARSPRRCTPVMTRPARGGAGGEPLFARSGRSARRRSRASTRSATPPTRAAPRCRRPSRRSETSAASRDARSRRENLARCPHEPADERRDRAPAGPDLLLARSTNGFDQSATTCGPTAGRLQLARTALNQACSATHAATELRGRRSSEAAARLAGRDDERRRPPTRLERAGDSAPTPRLRVAAERTAAGGDGRTRPSDAPAGSGRARLPAPGAASDEPAPRQPSPRTPCSSAWRPRSRDRRRLPRLQRERGPAVGADLPRHGRGADRDQPREGQRGADRRRPRRASSTRSRRVRTTTAASRRSWT